MESDNKQNEQLKKSPINKNKNKNKNIVMFALIMVVLIAILVFNNMLVKNPERIELNQLVTLLQENSIEVIYTQSNNEVGKILLKTSDIEREDFPAKADYTFVYSENTNDILIEYYSDETCDFEWVQDTAAVNYLTTLMPLLYILLFVGGAILIFMIIAKTNSKSISFGKNSKARVLENVKIRFSDVAGVDEEKEDLKEVVDFLKNPKKYTDVGARIPKGVLLVGPPGTGKTMLAKAIAGESNVPFFSMSGSDFVEMFVGVGASRVRDLFDQAKRSKPSLVFIDEIDAVGRQRGTGLGGGNDEREQTLNQLLVEMDGFENNEGIIVIAATNRADVLDPALTRPGRFDRTVYIYPPDVKGREEIIKVYIKNKKLGEDVDVQKLARLTSGFCGADIENLINEAALRIASDNRTIITMEDVTESINKVIMGRQKKSRLITEKTKKITAYHEAGHAIIGKLLPNCNNVQEVSIIPRGMAAGYTVSRSDDDESFMTLNKLNDELCMMMGGRVAEQIVLGDFTTGAQNDIQRATSIARRMVVEWGMSNKLGFIGFDSSQEMFLGKNYQKQLSYSEKLASEIDEEIKSILDFNYQRAEKLLNSNIVILHNMAKLLIDEETIYQDEVDMLLEGSSVEEVAESIKLKEAERQSKEKIAKKTKSIEDIKNLQQVKLKNVANMRILNVITEQEEKKMIQQIEIETDEQIKNIEQMFDGLTNEKAKTITDEEESKKESDEN